MRWALVTALLLLAPPVQAQALCVPHDSMAQELSDGWGEVADQWGISLDGSAMLELYISPEGTFSIVMVRPNGIACIMYSGKEWQKIKRATKPGDPA